MRAAKPARQAGGRGHDGRLMGRLLGRLALAGLLAAGSAVSAAGDSTGDATADATEQAARGAAIVASRSQGLCGLCHALPGQPAHLQGTIAPPLHGVGARYDAAALRARLLAPERFNPDSLMPAYGRTEGLLRVVPAQRGKPLLGAQQIDDVVAYLASLK